MVSALEVGKQYTIGCPNIIEDHLGDIVSINIDDILTINDISDDSLATAEEVRGDILIVLKGTSYSLPVQVLLDANLSEAS